MAKSDLLRSHDELRAALRVAGKEIRKLNFGRADTPVLKLLRRVLRESRVVAAAEQRDTAGASFNENCRLYPSGNVNTLRNAQLLGNEDAHSLFLAQSRTNNVLPMDEQCL